jgi:hypothetical protein
MDFQKSVHGMFVSELPTRCLYFTMPDADYDGQPDWIEVLRGPVISNAYITKGDRLDLANLLNKLHGSLIAAQAQLDKQEGPLKAPKADDITAGFKEMSSMSSHFFETQFLKISLTKFCSTDSFWSSGRISRSTIPCIG